MTNARFGIYVDNCIRILIVAFSADLIWRLANVVTEYTFNLNYYFGGNRILIIFKRAFTFNISTQIFLIIIFFVIFVRITLTKQLPFPPISSFTYMPIYWICFSAGINKSTLDYSYWLRSNHGLDYASGMASNYFHGYLNLALSSDNNELSIRERIKLYENREKVQFALKKLIILIPNTSFIPSRIDSPLLTKVKPLEIVKKDRAGVERPFKNDVYMFNLNGTAYYIAMEGATPMLSFFEAMNSTRSTTWQMQQMQREIFLKFYKHLKKLLSKWPETKKNVEPVLYCTHTADGKQQDIGAVVIAHVKNLWKANG